jgi:hypothetical protein
MRAGDEVVNILAEGRDVTELHKAWKIDYTATD